MFEVLTHYIILIITLWYGYYYYPHFVEEAFLRHREINYPPKVTQLVRGAAGPRQAGAKVSTFNHMECCLPLDRACIYSVRFAKWHLRLYGLSLIYIYQGSAFGFFLFLLDVLSQDNSFNYHPHPDYFQISNCRSEHYRVLMIHINWTFFTCKSQSQLRFNLNWTTR